ncbi:MAG: ROK family protein [Patescibacteria group bacterium]
MYIGLDIGGTKIRGVLVDAVSKKILSKFIVLTPKSKTAFLKTLDTEIVKLVGKNKISGVGVGLASVVGEYGFLGKTSKFPFMGKWNAKKFFAKFHSKVKIDNDCRCFLRAEATLGAAKNKKNVLAITIGTGIGSGIMIDGEIYSGSSNSAGEVGHIIIDGNKTFEESAAKKAFQKYGDRSKIIGIGVANLINVLNPDIVILGGGGILTGKVDLKTVRSVAKKYIAPPLAKKTLIIKSRLGELGPALGAAIMSQKS